MQAAGEAAEQRLVEQGVHTCDESIDFTPGPAFGNPSGPEAAVATASLLQEADLAIESLGIQWREWSARLGFPDHPLGGLLPLAVTAERERALQQLIALSQAAGTTLMTPEEILASCAAISLLAPLQPRQESPI